MTAGPVASAPLRLQVNGPPVATPDAAAAAPQPPRLSGRSGYSLFVACMKLVLPALAAGLVLLVIMWPQIRPSEDRFRIGVSDLSLEQAENLSMLNARIEGLDEDNQPYTLTADVVTQATGKDTLVHLELPKGDITLKDGTWLALMAKSGLYDRASKMLELKGQVVLFHDQGYEMRTSAARVDLGAAKAEVDEPIEGQGPAGFLSAEGFRLLDRGERILFLGRSSLIAFPEDLDTLPAGSLPGKGER